ncbi:MAG: AAA family ATPase, partial [Polyangiaceae bacterium]
LRPEVPSALVAIVKTAMAKAPEDRFPDAGRMYEALLTLLFEQGHRFGARDLAEFVARLRESREPSPAAPGLEREPEKPPSVPPSATSPPAEVEAVPREPPRRFVGRKDELRRIGEILALATRRSARVLTVRGEAGAGKTRLLSEVERRLRKGGHNVGFYAATCHADGGTTRLSGVVAMLQALCGVRGGEPADRILAVKPRLRALGLQEDETAAVLDVLGAARAATDRDVLLERAFAKMAHSLCEDRIHALAWDEAHRMDRDSFVMLRSVLRTLQSSRLVFVFAGQPALAHPMENVEGHFTIDLPPCEAAEVERLT